MRAALTLCLMGSLALQGNVASAAPKQVEVGLRLREHLRAVVKIDVVRDPTEPPVATCEDFRDVSVQRRSGGRWTTVATGQTNLRGRAIVEIEDRPGRYRARVPRTGGCRAGVSDVEPHRH